MAENTSIPRKDTDFDVRQRIIVTTASTKRTAWKLDADWLDDEVLPRKAVWDAAWAAYEDPNTRTTVITAKKNNAREDYETVLRPLIRTLQGNPLVTDIDLEAMGIALIPDEHTEAPVATESPDFDIDTSVIGRITIHFFKRGGSHKKGKPEGQHGAEIVWLLSDTPVVRWEDLRHSDVDTNSPYTLIFENDQRGKTIYFALRWVNTSSKKGPWSEILSAIIP
ncbi:MAG: hypothetical protein LBS12_06745 [Prevotellaceae bacterium]|jgi:hypothetical protein|nr:hypothetical protein [Prevotellaceae bacterium]